MLLVRIPTEFVVHFLHCTAALIAPNSTHLCQPTRVQRQNSHLLYLFQILPWLIVSNITMFISVKSHKSCPFHGSGLLNHLAETQQFAKGNVSLVSVYVTAARLSQLELLLPSHQKSQKFITPNHSCCWSFLWPQYIHYCPLLQYQFKLVRSLVTSGLGYLLDGIKWAWY